MNFKKQTMKRACIFLMGFFIGLYGYGQSASPEVISTAGDHFEAANISLSWTVGEPVIETYDSGSNELTQGFHQTNLLVTSVADLDEDVLIRVFPNPTSGEVNIEYTGLDDDLTVSLFDASGKRILVRYIFDQTNSTEIDLSNFASGGYFLHVQNANFQTIKTFKILKNN